MFNYNKFFLLASSALVVSGTMNVNMAYASIDKVLGTHTTHLPLELEPSSLNSSPSFKLAAICALGDEECGLNIGFGNSDKDTSAGAKKCRSNGYVLSQNCDAPKVAGAKCPYHPNYSKPCSCPTSYAQTCSAPYIGVGTGCDNKFTSCQCAATYKYSCTGTGYTGGSGTKCDSKFATCSCANGYNWNGSACVANSCSGYTASTCPAPKTTSTPNCLSATTQYYASCTCPTTYKYSCSGTGYAGGTGTGCDGKYTACSCANGYNWNGSACVANSCSGYTTSNCTSPKMLRTPNCLSATTQYYASCTCPASYQFSCSGTGYSGGNGSKCDAKFETCNCTSDYTWNGSACVPKVKSGKLYVKYNRTTCTNQEGGMDDGKKRYLVAIDGEMKCVDDTGKTLWQKSMWTSFGRLCSMWGTALPAWCADYDKPENFIKEVQNGLCGYTKYAGTFSLWDYGSADASICKENNTDPSPSILNTTPYTKLTVNCSCPTNYSTTTTCPSDQYTVSMTNDCGQVCKRCRKGKIFANTTQLGRCQVVSAWRQNDGCEFMNELIDANNAIPEELGQTALLGYLTTKRWCKYKNGSTKDLDNLDSRPCHWSNGGAYASAMGFLFPYNAKDDGLAKCQAEMKNAGIPGDYEPFSNFDTGLYCD